MAWSSLARAARAFGSVGSLQSGHNKWSKIRHKKAALDTARAANHVRILTDIERATVLNGDDPSFNPRLSALLNLARNSNVPKANVENAIRRGSKKDISNAARELVTYEGLGPGGVALVIEALTDNKNRTVANVKSVLRKRGGTLGSTLYRFARKGMIKVSKSRNTTVDDLYELIQEIDIEDVLEHDAEIELIFDPKLLNDVSKLLEQKQYTIEEAKLVWIPQSSNLIDADSEDATLLFRLIDELEEDPDVIDVYADCKFDSE